MSLISEKIVVAPTEEQLASVRAFVRAQLTVEQSGMSKPQMTANVHLTVGAAEKPMICTLLEFTELAHQIAQVYRAIYGKDWA